MTVELKKEDLDCKNIKYVGISADDKLYHIIIEKHDGKIIRLKFEQILRDSQIIKEAREALFRLIELWYGGNKKMIGEQISKLQKIVDGK